MKFTETAFGEYAHERNKLLYYTVYGLLGLLILGFLSNQLFDVRFGVLSSIATQVRGLIESGSPLGVFYLTGIGGYFVFTFPLEAFYVNSLSSTPAILAVVLAMLGVVVSYTLNYYTGLYFADLVKPLLGPKSYYWWKSKLARHGPVLIVIVNIIPMISQSFTVALGLFNYNRTRTALYTFIGQLIKFGGLTLLAQHI